MDAFAPDYKPSAASMPRLPAFDLPLIEADSENLKGYGEIVDHPEARKIEIVPWPLQGRRPLDAGTGDQGGTTEGLFEFFWQGDVLRAQNQAVADDYVLGWSRQPCEASEEVASCQREEVLIWHANYHPDGGQLFFPQKRAPFVAPLALPGDEVTPEDFKAFWFDGSQGLYIHPGIWHEAVFPVTDRQVFFDRQGKVHGRVSVDFAEEFGCYLRAKLPAQI